MQLLDSKNADFNADLNSYRIFLIAETADFPRKGAKLFSPHLVTFLLVSKSLPSQHSDGNICI